MKLREHLKLREEDGFFLLINLNDESIIKGYPSFFKINSSGKAIIEYLQKGEYKEEDVKKTFINNGVSENGIAKFLSFLKEFDLCYE